MNFKQLIKDKETAILDSDMKESIALLYHENSKLSAQSGRALGSRIGAFLANPYFVEKSNVPFKQYPHKPQIDLSAYQNMPFNAAKSHLFDLLLQRQSRRQFNPQHHISLYELFVLLHYSYGVMRKEALKGYPFEGYVHHRSVPSGGGLYPLEIYVVVLKGYIEQGLYHFRSDSCALEILEKKDYTEEMKLMTGVQNYVSMNEVNAVIITTSVFQRTMTKYGDRGYRFIMHENGSVAMMMSLLCEYLNLGSCLMGGYLDEDLNRLIGIDGFYESVINVMLIGGKPQFNND